MRGKATFHALLILHSRYGRQNSGHFFRTPSLHKGALPGEKVKHLYTASNENLYLPEHMCEVCRALLIWPVVSFPFVAILAQAWLLAGEQEQGRLRVQEDQLVDGASEEPRFESH